MVIFRPITGQAVTEFILMLALLSLIGLWIMRAMIGPKGDSGGLAVMRATGVQKIADDGD
jgi:hypothetical protein